MKKKKELKAAPEFKPTALTDEAMEKVVGGIGIPKLDEVGEFGLLKSGKADGFGIIKAGEGNFVKEATCLGSK